MNYELSEEEVQTVLKCVTDCRDMHQKVADRLNANGSARVRQDSLIMVRNCNDVLRTLSERWDTYDGAGIS